MLNTATKSGCCEKNLRSIKGIYQYRTSTEMSPQFEAAPIRPRVLVIEFRDEVYAGLNAMLEEHDCDVARSEVSETVAESFVRFSPDLVLLNEAMPNESGWLITCKLRMALCNQPIWLYAAKNPHPLSVWLEFSGVSEVIEYGGVLFRLIEHVRQRLDEWIIEPACKLQENVSPVYNFQSTFPCFPAR